MTDITKAIAAAREASGKAIIAEQEQDSEAVREALRECFHTQRNLLAALDAVRGEAVWQYRATSQGQTWVDCRDEQIARTMKANGFEIRCLYAAPPAATVIDRISDERLRAIHREEQFGLFCDYEEFVSIARHLEALLTRAVPEGYKVVPVEPTDAMVREAGFAVTDLPVSDYTARAVWEAMLAAAANKENTNG